MEHRVGSSQPMGRSRTAFPKQVVQVGITEQSMGNPDGGPGPDVGQNPKIQDRWTGISMRVLNLSL